MPARGDATNAARPGSRATATGLFGMAMLTVLFAWWAWQDGAYFETVLLPGVILLCAGVVVLARGARESVGSLASFPVAPALGALILLGGWALASALWSPAPDVAVTDGQRILTYALCFGCGLWFGALLGPWRDLALVPLTAAAAFAGVMTLIALLTGDQPRSYLETDGTLDYPLGYRNANAAFFAIATFPAVGVAVGRTVDWRLRALALGTASLSLSLFLLSQSRAALPALVLALVVYLLASPVRLRALAWLALAIAPALATLPAAIALHGAGDDVAESVDELRAAGLAAAAATAGAFVLGAVAARLASRRPDRAGHARRSNRAVGLGLAAAFVVAAAAFLVRVGDPIDWLDDRADEFLEAGTPDLSERSTRFTVNLGSGRDDFWRVALREAGEAPLLGTGGGGYEYAYTRDREVGSRYGRDAHSIELEVLSELGVPGLVLLLAALAGVFMGVRRARSSGPAAAALGAVALGAGTYWLAHSSVDWFWGYAGVTAPVFALLGAACARTERRGSGSRGRARLALVAIAVLGVTAVPPFLAARYLNDAYDGWRADPQRAYSDLDRADWLNPLSDRALLAEAAIASEIGDRQRALGAFMEAIRRRPEEWASHYLAAELMARSDRAAARAEAEIALRLNPLGERTRALAERLGLEVPSLDGD